MSPDLKSFVTRGRGGNLENRRALAEAAKIKPKTSLEKPYQAASQYRPASAISPTPIHSALVQSRQHLDAVELGSFADTTLGDDSDDATVSSVHGNDEQSQWFYKTEDRYHDGEGIGEEIARDVKVDGQRWDRQVVENGNFQLDHTRFQASPERNQPPLLSVSQQALFHDLRQQNPRIAQILVEKDEKEASHNLLSQSELPFPTQSRKSGRFENAARKGYTNLQQVQSNQAGVTDGPAIHSQRHDLRGISRGLDTSSPGPIPSAGEAQLPLIDASLSEFSYGSLSREPSPSERTPMAKRKLPSSSTAMPESIERKRTVVELDYDGNTLFNMKYSELQAQAFDTNPKSALLATDQSADQRPLADRLQHFAGLAADSQTQFFSCLPKDEWDESGEWFISRFAHLITRVRACRDEKRAISKQFEDELAAREETLRARSSEIDETLQAMKKGGESVLKGKSV